MFAALPLSVPAQHFQLIAIVLRRRRVLAATGDLEILRLPGLDRAGEIGRILIHKFQMASKRGSQRLRVLTLIGMLVLSGVGFYGAYDALSTGATKAPGRNNNHYVTLASEPHVFHSLVEVDLAFGVLFAVLGIVSYIFGASKEAPDDDEK